MMQTFGCEEFAARGFGERYLAHKLSPPEQDAFEAHFLTCKRCQDSLTLGAGIRAAWPKEAAPRPRRLWLAWGGGLGLAAAAGVAAVLLLPSRLPPELIRLGAVAQAPIYLGVPVRADQPAAADSLFGAAMAAYAAERYAEASTALRAALRAGVDSTPAEFFLAASALLGGDADVAETGFARVLALGDTPYRTEAHFYRAKALLRLGRTDEAVVELRSAVARDGVIAAHARALADSVQRVAR